MSKTPLTDAVDATWTKWLQDTWSGVKDIRNDAAPITPIEHARRMEEDRAELLGALELCIERMPTNDPLYSRQVGEAFNSARSAIAKVK